MAKVLYIKCDAQKDNESRTYRMSDAFVEEYKKTHPEDEIVVLDLYAEDIDFLPKDKVMEVHIPAQGENREHPILKYAYQFADADKYIVAAPFWNLSFPAILKAYIDYVCVTGITFKYTATGAVGLCKQESKAMYIVSRGGEYSTPPADQFDMGTPYLRTLFAFMGVKNFDVISANGLDVIGNDVEAIMSKAIAEAQEKAKQF